jgi:hypothetical protein
MTKPQFWRSAGKHLLERDAQGWLKVAPCLLRAYYARPELQPIATSCTAEISLHEGLMADPLRSVADVELAAIADKEAADNYRQVLAYRDLLLRAGTIEGAYLRLMRQSERAIAPLFIDQMVHLIAHNMLEECTDPIRVRAAELLFREQMASTQHGQLMLADAEIVDMHALRAREGANGLSLAGGATEGVELDVLTEENGQSYWSRSDRFDTVIDFRYGTPALDAFARVIEAWLQHLLRLAVRVEPRPSISDGDWRWHIGLDRHATAILDTLYAGKTLPLEDRERIVALFRMRIDDERMVIEDVKGKPIYLALAMDLAKRVKMKPQNLLVNLPLAADV